MDGARDLARSGGVPSEHDEDVEPWERVESPSRGPATSSRRERGPRGHAARAALQVVDGASAGGERAAETSGEQPAPEASAITAGEAPAGAEPSPEEASTAGEQALTEAETLSGDEAAAAREAAPEAELAAGEDAAADAGGAAEGAAGEAAAEGAAGETAAAGEGEAPAEEGAEEEASEEEDDEDEEEAAEGGEEAAESAPAAEEEQPGGPDGQFDPAAAPIPPMRIGGTRPPIIGPPPRMEPAKASSIHEQTGLRPREHHDRVRWALRTLSQTADRGQRAVVKQIENLAGEISQVVVADAVRLPGLAAGAIARVRSTISRAIADIRAAADGTIALIQTHHQDNRSGVDDIAETTVANIEDVVTLGGTQISNAFTNTMDLFDEVAEMYAADLSAVPGEMTPGFVATLTTLADTYKQQSTADPIDDYRAERRAANLPALARQAYQARERGASARADALTSEPMRSQIAMQFLQLSNPAAVKQEASAAASEGSIEGEAQQTTLRLASARELAVGTVESTRDGAITQLEQLQTSLVDGLTRAGRLGERGLSAQALAMARGLRAMGGPLADSYAQLMEGFRKMFPPRQFYNHEVYRERIEKGIDDAEAMRARHLETITQRASESVAGGRRAFREQASGISSMVSTGITNTEAARAAATGAIHRVGQQFIGQMNEQAAHVGEQAPEHESAATEQLQTFADQVEDVMFQAIVTGVDGQPSLMDNFEQQLEDFRDECDQERDRFDENARRSDGVYAQIDTDTWDTVDTGAFELRQGVEHTVAGFSATDEDRIFNVFLPLTVKGIKATERRYNDRYPSDNLRRRLISELDEDDDEKEAAVAFLDGLRAKAVRYVVASSNHWYGRDEDRAVSAVRSLDAAERAELEQVDGWESTRTSLIEDLGTTDTQIVEAYLGGDRARAVALQMERDLTRTRRTTNEDGVVDTMARMDARLREELELEHRDRRIETEDVSALRVDVMRAHAVVTGQVTADEREGLDAGRATRLFVEHATRPLEVFVSDGSGHGHIEVREPSAELRGYLEEAAARGSDSEEARGARLAYEHRQAESRGLTETRMERIHSVAEHRGLSRALENLRIAESRDPADAQAIARAHAAVEQEREAHDRFVGSYVTRLGRPDLAAPGADPNDARAFAADSLAAVFEDETAGRDFASELITTGRPSLLSATLLATHRSGTHEALLEAAYAGRTHAEFQQLRSDYARHVGSSDPNALDEHLGTFGHGGSFTELSGDDRQRIELLMAGGDAGADSSDRDRARLMAMRYRHQYGETGAGGRYAMSGTDEEANLHGDHDRMVELITAAAAARGNHDPAFDPVTGEPNPAAFNPETGELLGANESDWREFRDLSISVRNSAEAYKAGIERAESLLTTIIQAIGAIVAVALMFVPGVNLLVAGVAAAVITGMLTVAVKATMRGSRYGWEEALVDVGMTAVDAATAAIGGSKLLRFASMGRVGGAMAREAITGAVGMAANVAMQDETWKDGLAAGFSRIGGGALRGAVVGAVTAGVSEGASRKLGAALDPSDVLNPSSLQRMGQRLGHRGRDVVSEGLSEGLGSMVGEAAGIGVDVGRGEFRGGLDQALAQIGQAGVRDLLTGSLRSVAMSRARGRRDALQRELLTQSGPPTADQLRRLRSFSVAAGDFDLLGSDGPARLAAQLAVSRSLLGDLPPAVRARFAGFPPDALARIRDIVRAGDGGTIEQRRELAALGRTLGMDVDVARLTADLNAATAARASTDAQRAPLPRVAEPGAVPANRRARVEALDDFPEHLRSALADLPPDAADLLRLLRLRGEAIPPGLQVELLRRALVDNPALDTDALLRALGEAVPVPHEAPPGRTAEPAAPRLAGVPEELHGVLGAIPDRALLDLRIALARGELSPSARQRLIDAAVRDRPNVDVAELSRALQEAVRRAGPEAAVSGEELGRLRAELAAAVPLSQRAALEGVPILVLDPAEFSAFTRSASGRAVTLIVDGQPVVVMRSDAEPSVLREEGLHVLQVQDPRWRRHVELLDESRLARWDELSLEDQMATYHAKLDLEIDAHHRLMASLQRDLAGTGGVAAAHLRDLLDDARSALDNLQRRRGEVEGYARARAADPRTPRPDWLDQPARLFVKKSDTLRAIRQALGQNEPAFRDLIEDLSKTPALSSILAKIRPASDLPGTLQIIQRLRDLPDGDRILASIAKMRFIDAPALLADVARVVDVTAVPPEIRVRLLEAVFRPDDARSAIPQPDRHRALEVIRGLLDGVVRSELSTDTLATVAEMAHSRGPVDRLDLLEAIARLHEAAGIKDEHRDDLAGLADSLIQGALTRRERINYLRDVTPLAELLRSAAPELAPDVAQIVQRARGARVDGDSPIDAAIDLHEASRRIPSGDDARAAHVAKMAQNYQDTGFLVGAASAWSLRLDEAAQRIEPLQRAHAGVAAAIDAVTAGRWGDGHRALLLERAGWLERLLDLRNKSRPEGTPPLRMEQLLREFISEQPPGSPSRWLDIDRGIREATVAARLRGRALDQNSAIDALNLPKTARAQLETRPDRETIRQHLLDLARHEQKFAEMVRIAEEVALEQRKAGLRPDENIGDPVTDADIGSWRARLTEAQGERALTHYMLVNNDGKGPPPYLLAVPFREGTGYDQVWVRLADDGSILEYLVGEAKGPTASLAEGQMGRDWVRSRMDLLPDTYRVPGSEQPLREAMQDAAEEGDPPVRGVIIQGDAPGAGRPDPSYKNLPVPDRGGSDEGYFGSGVR